MARHRKKFPRFFDFYFIQFVISEFLTVHGDFGGVLKALARFCPTGLARSTLQVALPDTSQ